MFLFYFLFSSYENKLILPPKKRQIVLHAKKDHPDLYCLLAEFRGSASSSLVITIRSMRGFPCSTVAPSLVSGGGSYCSRMVRMEVFLSPRCRPFYQQS